MLSYYTVEIFFCDFTQLRGGGGNWSEGVSPNCSFADGWPGGAGVTRGTRGVRVFLALSEGLQNALRASAGVPGELRMDRISAVCRNRQPISARISPSGITTVAAPTAWSVAATIWV